MRAGLRPGGPAGHVFLVAAVLQLRPLSGHGGSPPAVSVVRSPRRSAAETSGGHAGLGRGLASGQ